MIHFDLTIIYWLGEHIVQNINYFICIMNG